MQSYIIRRLLLIIPTIFFISIIVFFLIRFIPGGAIDIIQAQLSQSGVEVDRAEIERYLGLDVPAYVQYIRWIGNIVLHGDFGDSLIQGSPVINMVTSRLPVTLELAFLAIIIDLLIALPIGVFSAVRQDTLGDYVARSFSIILIAVPSFWIATLIMIYPSIWFGWAPSMKLVPLLEDPLGNLKMFIIPAVLLGMAVAGSVMRLTRTMMLEVLRQDYIRTAWAKGLNERSVILQHSIKNAFIPVITIIGQQTALLIGGSVIIESIFSLPGMGQLVLQALNQRDYPLVSAITLIFSFFIVFINLIVDISYSLLDPRIRYN